MKSLRQALVFCAIAASLSCGGDDNDENNTNNNTKVPDGQAVVVSEHLQAFELTEASFFDVMRTHDFDADGKLDASDVAVLRECVASATVGARPECDVVPDGELNSADIRLLDMLVGSSTPRTSEAINRLADTLEDLATGEFSADLFALTVDYDGSGQGDAADVLFVVGKLRDDPASKYDFDDSGVIDLRDVAELARNLETVSGMAAAARFDVSGDGTVDDTDLMLLGELAIYTSDISVGLLDHNLDTAVTLDDYCVVSDMPANTSLFGLVMPIGIAAAIPTRSALCRADGRAMVRAAMDFDTGQRVLALPAALFLEEVTEVPSGWSPIGQAPDDAVLYAVTTTATDRPVSALSLPGLTGNESVGTTLELSGPALAANATLVTPYAFVPMAARAEGIVNALTVSGSTTEYEIHILETIITEEEAGEAREFESKINEALATYDTYISQCPCTLDASERAKLVQGLLRMKNCLKAVSAAAQSSLEDVQSNHGSITRESVFKGRLAAIRWQHLSEVVRDIEWVKTLLLVLEASYDWGTGGPGKAFEGAVGNLVGELANDNGLANDFWDTTSPSSPGGDALLGMSVGSGASLVTGPLTGALTDALSKGGKRLGAKAFGELVLDHVGKNIGKYNPPNMEAFLKTIIKALPGLYLDYVKAQAFEGEHQAQEAAGAYNTSVYAIGNWENVVTSMNSAGVAVQSKLDQLLAKFSADGCPMTISSSDPCQPVLDAALQKASMTLATDLGAANAQIDSALGKLTGTSGQQSCLSGEQRRILDNVSFSSADRSRAVAELVTKVDAEQVQKQVDIEIQRTTTQSAEARATFEAQCFGEWLEQPLQNDSVWQELKAGQDAKQAALDAHDQAIKDAITAYQTCAQDGGGACGGSSTTANSTPWTAAAGCVSCVPAVVMDCGDDDFVSLGDDIGLSDAALGMALNIMSFEHSALEIGSIPTAMDHTTMDRFHWESLMFSQQDLDALDMQFPCSSADVFCAGSTMPVGEYDVILVNHMGMMPLSDNVNYYQFAAVFDADAMSANNYMADSAFPDDYFDGTDTWYQFNGAQGSFTYGRTIMMNGSPVAAASSARLVVKGTAVAHIIPRMEVSMGMMGGTRISAFRHPGDYGITSMDYDGSVWPAKADGLYTP